MKFLPLLALSALLSLSARAADTSPLAGAWHFEPGRSTELSPWKDYGLTITVAGDAITLQRHLAWGRREFADRTTVVIGRTETVPLEMWPDNRHLGAYISGDRTARIRAEWLDAGRILRLSSDLVLSTQQGDRAINILSDYKVSANGALLTLTELRSTRNRPIVYVFSRVPTTISAKP